MAVHQFQLVFNCTLAQLEVALLTTLPAVGFTVIRAPNNNNGIIIGTASGTGAAAGLGQCDFTYDGQYFLKFFGANPIPTALQASAGISENQMAPALVTELNTALLATLGAPVISPNLAIPPSFVP